MEWTSVDLDNCPVVRALDVVGSRWTLLVLREMFNGVHRFEDIQQHLGVSTSVLSRRLAEMAEHGLVDRIPYRDEGRRERSEYRPTPIAWELYPVVVGLMQWGDRHLTGPNRPTVQLVQTSTGKPVVAALVTADATTCTPADLTVLTSEPDK
ncbi:winged helix-turn-helix transcriptional regulator [Nocardia bovistercoris]|uniref:Helix-turn-helix transcriptional regulator n=1 Tax=Nocardia bovistercoris TaxID=2785916 RepID=A0A931N0C9_9NOCA|nr:helix-turn-helix domain-containing protein [Nocardia bovistercoris]MBH0777125.1 helix-turn-helix transcriptional regulator [Nocardia bovistercoris]